MRYSRTLLGSVAALALAASFATTGLADDDDDHEIARRALAEGRILPLKDILKRLNAQLPGQVIDVDLEDEDGRLEYEIKVLTPEGRIMEAEIDAATGRVLGIEEDD